MARPLLHRQRVEARPGAKSDRRALRWSRYGQRYPPKRPHRDGPIGRDARLFDQVRKPHDFLSIGGAIAQAVSHGLERVSRETGGLSFPNPGHRTSEVFSKIESDLRNMYVLGFTPPADARDGRFHRLDVTTTRPDLVVRSRAGYWAGGTQ